MQNENDYSDPYKYRLEYFSEERAKKGEPVSTVRGEPVTITEYGLDKVRGIVNGVKYSWFKDGHWLSDKKLNNGDLCHPVLIENVKTKRIPFDASRVNEEGVKVVCRNDEDWSYRGIIKTDLQHERPILAIFADKSGVEIPSQHLPNGKINANYESEFDLFLEVIGTESTLPTELEIAQKLGSSILKVVNEEGINPWIAYQDMPRIEAMAKLMSVARFVNDGWEPDWSCKNQLKYCWGTLDGINIIDDSTGTENHGTVFFKDLEALKRGREILNYWYPGDIILKRVLGIN